MWQQMSLTACRALLGVAAAVWLALPFSARAAGASAALITPADAAHCVAPTNLSLYRLLPPFPPVGSAQARSELDELLRMQAQRTPAQAARARADAEVSIFRFADALGSPAQFTAPHLPRTTALFDELGEDESAVVGPVKDEFARPRPFTVEPRLQPSVPRSRTGSYPSGHAAWAYTVALVLADMVPERRQQILERADEYAHNRNVGGVHYPSDVDAGHLAATAIAAMLFACTPFQRDETAAAAELRGVLGLPVRPAPQP
jgi:acid phosphatase (class A)